jgi:hypothetical protein
MAATPLISSEETVTSTSPGIVIVTSSPLAASTTVKLAAEAVKEYSPSIVAAKIFLLNTLITIPFSTEKP